MEAMVICTALGFDGKTDCIGSGDCKGAEGRMERWYSLMATVGEHPVVIVDYAHTPDALKNVASTLAELKTGSELIIVFGCGGDRDKSKRPEMAKIAETYADRSHRHLRQPRTEDPDEIIEDITGGFSGRFSYRCLHLTQGCHS
jgi:UDP-N-acetylmuramoyl-L-alanyl-D-glutamate--2,6-diaminopimelate ligase